MRVVDQMATIFPFNLLTWILCSTLVVVKPTSLMGDNNNDDSRKLIRDVMVLPFNAPTWCRMSFVMTPSSSNLNIYYRKVQYKNILCIKSANIWVGSFLWAPKLERYKNPQQPTKSQSPYYVDKRVWYGLPKGITQSDGVHFKGRLTSFPQSTQYQRNQSEETQTKKIINLDYKC